MAYIPDRGEIVHLQFDPSAGNEMKGPHYGLIISSKLFNRHGLAMICPISQGIASQARTYGTIVTLMGSGTDTQGNVHCHQMKSLDWRVRKAKFKEVVPTFILDDVMARVEAVLFD